MLSLVLFHVKDSSVTDCKSSQEVASLLAGPSRVTTQLEDKLSPAIHDVWRIGQDSIEASIGEDCAGLGVKRLHLLTASPLEVSSRCSSNPCAKLLHQGSRLRATADAQARAGGKGQPKLCAEDEQQAQA
eukprot:m.177863 g.177863  ORF g.177863 m.177863 type:complete len:130 (-) comp9977_c0_seq5:326-715(-)